MRELERVIWHDKKTGEISTHDIRHVFHHDRSLAAHRMAAGCVAMDEKGFILTGRDSPAAQRRLSAPGR